MRTWCRYTATRELGVRPSGRTLAAIGLSDGDHFELPMTHYHSDVFYLDPATLKGAPVTGLVPFLMGTDGKIDLMAIPFERRALSCRSYSSSSPRRAAGRHDRRRCECR